MEIKVNGLKINYEWDTLLLLTAVIRLQRILATLGRCTLLKTAATERWR